MCDQCVGDLSGLLSVETAKTKNKDGRRTSRIPEAAVTAAGVSPLSASVDSE